MVISRCFLEAYKINLIKYAALLWTTAERITKLFPKLDQMMYIKNAISTRVTHTKHTKFVEEHTGVRKE